MKIAHSQIFRTQFASHKPAAPPTTPREQVDSLVLGAVAPVHRETQVSTSRPWPLATRVGIFSGFATGVAAGLAGPQMAACLAKGGLAGIVALPLVATGVLLANPAMGEKGQARVAAAAEGSWGAGGGILVGLPLGLAARALMGL
ncbi:MAG: hypothetical protein KF760_32065 [Candidatus Eremiobacteraeota bacterium]|nr:hypothetical protein [Candidatus Eremiobacteraeota bacterium]MCW5872725.1 hypothetical protein [Candidatus Eremiobacteraeota bacterium]